MIIIVIIMPLSFLFRFKRRCVFLHQLPVVLSLNAQIPCSTTSLFEVRKPAKAGELSENDDWEVHGVS